MTKLERDSMRDAINAVGLRLKADYSFITAKPLPPELKDLLAQLVAQESRKRDAVERPVLHSPSQYASVAIGGVIDPEDD